MDKYEKRRFHAQKVAEEEGAKRTRAEKKAAKAKAKAKEITEEEESSETSE